MIGRWALPIVIFAAGLSPATIAAAQPMAAGVDILSYKIGLKPDFKGRSLAGTSQIKFRATRGDLRQIVVETVKKHPGFELSYVSALPLPREMQPLFGTTAAMVRFLQEKAGLALPTRRYSQLLLPGNEAQEAATYSIIGLGQIEPILENPQEDWVVVHELSHQWWGNLVTCKTWDHLWLNEGMAVFMTAAWKEHRFGRAAYDAELDLARRRLAKVKEAAFDKPLAFPGPYPSLSARRAIQYSKGALFLDHLRTILGDRLFWAGIKHFSREHAGGVVESRDFQVSLEKASGRNLNQPFQDWLYGSSSIALPVS